MIRCIELAFAALEKPCVKWQMIYTSVMGVALHFTALRVCKCRDTERESLCVRIVGEQERVYRACAILYDCVCVWERDGERKRARKGPHRSVAPLLESLEMLSHCLTPVPAQGFCRDTHARTSTEPHTNTHHRRVVTATPGSRWYKGVGALRRRRKGGSG